MSAALRQKAEEYKQELKDIKDDQVARMPLDGEDFKDTRKALRFAAMGLNRGIVFPYRNEKEHITFYMNGSYVKREFPGRGGRPIAAAKKKR